VRRHLGDRWSVPVVAALLEGPLRYGEIQDRMPAIAPNILSARLRTLEREGLVVSSRYSAGPPRFEYRLTPDGGALADAIRLLAVWGGTREGADDDEAPARPVHEICGSALEIRWWCPTCDAAAAPAGDGPVFV
jgi:DNA-binding HxlR family transcriptional regulator